MPRFNRSEKNNVGKKNESEKDKIRKILREKDLKKHLKGKASIEGNATTKSWDETHKINQEIIALQEKIDKDPQLKRAISLLKGWSIMSKSYVTNK